MKKFTLDHFTSVAVILVMLTPVNALANSTFIKALSIPATACTVVRNDITSLISRVLGIWGTYETSNNTLGNDLMISCPLPANGFAPFATKSSNTQVMTSFRLSYIDGDDPATDAW